MARKATPTKKNKTPAEEKDIDSESETITATMPKKGKATLELPDDPEILNPEEKLIEEEEVVDAEEDEDSEEEMVGLDAEEINPFGDKWEE
jgi:hypothetical protein